MNILDGFLKPGLVCFTTNKESWISNTIRWFQKLSDKEAIFTHTFIYLGQVREIDLHIIWESAEYGVRPNLLNAYINKNSRVEFWELNADTKRMIEAIEVAAKETYGKMYGYGMLLGHAIKKIFNKKENPIKAGIICCEEVMNVLRLVNPEWLSIDKDSIDVNELYKLVRANGKLYAVSNFDSEDIICLNA